MKLYEKYSLPRPQPATSKVDLKWLNTNFPELPESLLCRSFNSAARLMSQGCQVENLLSAQTSHEEVILPHLKRLQCVSYSTTVQCS